MYLIWYGLRELTGLPAATIARNLAEIAAGNVAGPRAVQLGIKRARTFPEVRRRTPTRRRDLAQAV